MLRDRVKIKKTVELSLTAEDWDLYMNMSESNLQIDAVARTLNEVFENSVNSGLGVDDTIRRVNNMMRSMSVYGADDSEPHRVLDRLINYIYGDSEL